MDYPERETATALKPTKIVAGEWYLRGFEDAYRARVPVIPWGPAGEQYNRGYSEGLAAVQRDFFTALSIHPVTVQTADI